MQHPGRTTTIHPRLALCLLALTGGACAPPPDADPVTDPGNEPTPPEETAPPDESGVEVLEAPGGAFVDIQCHHKHSRHPISSFTSMGARFGESGGTQTFQHLDTSCNRVEIDTNEHYKTGKHTFEGEVKIGDVSGQSVVQIFNAPASGPIMMIKAYGSDGGTLRKLAGSVTLVTGATGDWVRLRIVHDLSANTLEVFANGARKWSGSGGAGGSFNLKYGNYGTGAPTEVQWRNVSW
jgi:hypothetical protein